jgi:ABC-type amino acid transport substrate-binding protein
MNAKVVIFFALLCATFIIRYCIYNRTKSEPNTDNFVVGIAAGYAPFISINQQGDYEGFDIDCTQEIAQTLNKKLVLKDLGSMAPLLIALEQGSIDAIMWGMSITQERLNKFAMVHYQGKPTTSNPLLLAKSLPTGVATLADMDGMTICVEPASSHYDILKNYPNITLLTTEKVDDALLNILYKKADGAFIDPAIAAKFKTKYPELLIIDIPLDKKEWVQGVGIMINKTNNALIKQIEAVINQLKNNGTITRLEKKWGMV